LDTAGLVACDDDLIYFTTILQYTLAWLVQVGCVTTWFQQQ